MEFLKIGIEFLITFGLVFTFYYFFSIKKYKEDSKNIPIEVNLVLIKGKINPKQINMQKLIKAVCLITSFIIAISITLMSILSNNIIISIIVGVSLSVVLAIVTYGIIGKYYQKKINNKK